MFGLFGRRRPKIRPPKEREIFHFWDGVRERSIDPISAWRGLEGHDKFSLGTDLQLMHDVGDKKATDNTLAAVRDVFGIEPLTVAEDGTTRGLTERESISVLNSFFEYIERIKKKYAPAADFFATYRFDGICGTSAADARGELPEYEAVVGLYLHSERVGYRTATPVLMALQSAIKGVLGREWIDANTVSKAQADEQHGMANISWD